MGKIQKLAPARTGYFCLWGGGETPGCGGTDSSAGALARKTTCSFMRVGIFLMRACCGMQSPIRPRNPSLGLHCQMQRRTMRTQRTHTAHPMQL